MNHPISRAGILACLLFVSGILMAPFKLTAQVGGKVTEQHELREAFDHITLFDGAIEIGRTHTKLYLGGNGIPELIFKSFNDAKQPLEFVWSEEDQHYTIDYLKLPIIDMHYGTASYRVVTELIQVDWPGNEINWRMVPMLTVIPVE